MNSSLVILDTETATLFGAPHLLELGAVRVVDGEIEDQFESFVCPQIEIEDEATEIHGIKQDDVRNAPLIEEVLESFTEWAGESWLAAHNAPFDAAVLGFEYARLDMTPPPGVFIDSLTLARKLIPESIDHKLGTLCQYLELEEGPLHRALSDAVYCWMVIAECIERLEDEDGADPVSFHTLASRCGAPLSIESAQPRFPRMPQRLRPLENAMRTHNELTLVYGTGQDTPAHLHVRPRFLFQRKKVGYLEAECQRSGTLKTYRLDRVQKVLSTSN
ncbi:MAG: DNA polymerase III epsilon subunit family exonuclease [Planctomycetota bacterium]|jgi:DNA polymerase III epsilon subunit family exonuclease